MFHFDYKTQNTCSQLISPDIDSDRVYNVSFTGGCSGNLKAITVMHKGRSDPDDCKAAAEFAKKIISQGEK